MSTRSDRYAQPSDGVLCPKCLLANTTSAAFCADCGAPIGMVAAIDPIQLIQAEGFAYRSAVEGPPKLIIIAGMWLLFAPTVVAGALFLSDQSARGIPETGFFTILAVGSAIILYRATKNYVVKSRAINQRVG